jgi:hypothetical protein
VRIPVAVVGAQGCRKGDVVSMPSKYQGEVGV